MFCWYHFCPCSYVHLFVSMRNIIQKPLNGSVAYFTGALMCLKNIRNSSIKLTKWVTIDKHVGVTHFAGAAVKGQELVTLWGVAAGGRACSPGCPPSLLHVFYVLQDTLLLKMSRQHGDCGYLLLFWNQRKFPKHSFWQPGSSIRKPKKPILPS